MSAERPSFVAEWEVGERYVVTLTLPRIVNGQVRSACIEWQPQPIKLTETEVREYREGRAKAMARLARELGGTVAVVEA